VKLPDLDSVWLFLPLAGVVLASSLEPLPPYDFWWHLVMGRQLAAGSIPETQIFLYTMDAGAAFHDQPWLAQWLMFRAHEAGGFVGGMFLRTLLLLTAWLVLLGAAVRRSGPRVGGGLALAAVLVSYPVLTYRTRLFAFLPFVILIATLLADKRSKWAPVWLFVATVWWAYVHGTFVLAPILTFGAFGAVLLEGFAQNRLAETMREDGGWWLKVLASTFAGVLVTPHGLENLSYVVGLAVTSNVSATVSEWLPPDLSTGMGLAWAIAFVVTVAVMFVERSNVRVVEAALLLATTYLAASAIRSVFWWSAVAALVLAPHVLTVLRRVGPAVSDGEPDSGNLLNLAMIVMFGAAAVGLHPGVAPADLRVQIGGGRYASAGAGAGILSSEHGLTEVKLALQGSKAGNVFHDQALGGVVEWQSQRAEPVAFVDQRMELIPEPVWETYFRTSSANGWRETFDKYDIRSAVISAEGQWPLVQALDEAPDWRLVRVGHMHWVFVRID
jgi:hypothetical protein